MTKYIDLIEAIAAQNTSSQCDGYSQILRLCDALREEYEDLLSRSEE